MTVASSVREGLAKLSGSSGDLTGIDPETITQVYAFDWTDGSDQTIRDLSGRGAIVDKQFAEDEDLHVNDTFNLLTADGDETLLTVRGIYEAPPFYPLLGKASILQSSFDELYQRPENAFTFLNTRGGTSESVKESLEAAVADFPDAKVQSREEWITAQDQEFDDFLLLLYVLLALSVIVSVFGMINTLVLSVFERTRELGMLRAVGMTRHQVSRMVRQESVITALIGAALGLPLGDVPRGSGHRGAVAVRRAAQAALARPCCLRGDRHDRRGDRRGASSAPGEPAQRAARAPVRVAPLLSTRARPTRVGMTSSRRPLRA